MSIENPSWRLEIWHEGAKAADIGNDEFRLVVADLVQFEARHREAARARAEAEAAALAAAAADEEDEGDDGEDDGEDEAFSEAGMCWAHFAAAALHRKGTTAAAAAAMADELLAEYARRFSDAA